MSFEDSVYQLRQQKLRDIEALGQQAYPHKFAFTHTVPQVLADYGEKTAEQLENPRVPVKVAGRIISIRLQGKAGFAHLQQGGKRLQIYVKLDFVGEKGFALYKLLDLGDHIGVKRLSLPHPHRRADASTRKTSPSWPRIFCLCRKNGTA